MTELQVYSQYSIKIKTQQDSMLTDSHKYKSFSFPVFQRYSHANFGRMIWGYTSSEELQIRAM